MPRTSAETLLLVIALSMLITPLLFILYDIQSRKRDRMPPCTVRPDEIDEAGAVIIAGIGRFGQIVNRLVAGVGLQARSCWTTTSKTIAADAELRLQGVLRRSRPGRILLRAAGLREAQVLVVALDDPGRGSTSWCSYARQQRPDLHIVARARDRTHVYAPLPGGRRRHRARDVRQLAARRALCAGEYGPDRFRGGTKRETVFYEHDRHDVCANWPNSGGPTSRRPEEPGLCRARPGAATRSSKPPWLRRDDRSDTAEPRA